MGSNIGAFEALAFAEQQSAPADAKLALDRAVDTAVYRATQAGFAAYLAGARSKTDMDDRWEEVSPKVIKIIAECTFPTPGVIRRVGKALRPRVAPLPPTKTASTPAPAAVEDSIVRVGATQKHAWSYDQTTKLYTHTGSFEAFSCPGCGDKQKHLGFNKCAGCKRTFNSWIIRDASSTKTGAAGDVLMCREIKMRGDQFRLAAADDNGDSKPPWLKDDDSDSDDDSGDDDKKDDKKDDNKGDDDVKKEATVVGAEPPPGMMQPNAGTMPGDNSGATGAPMGPMGGPSPADPDGDGDVPGTEGSLFDHVQDALTGAVVALQDVQMLAVGNPMSVTSATRTNKVAKLRESMDRFWGLHKQLNYIAGQLAKEANQAIRDVSPRRNEEQEFVNGYYAASRNQPLPDVAKTPRPWLEGYVAFHKQADAYPAGGNIGGLFGGQVDQDDSAGNDNKGNWLSGTGEVPADENRGDAGLNGGSGTPSEAPFIDRAEGIDGRGQNVGDASTMKFEGAAGRGTQVSPGPKVTTTPNRPRTRRAG